MQTLFKTMGSNRKRVIALTLTLVLLLSMLPAFTLTAAAAYEVTVSTSKQLDDAIKNAPDGDPVTIIATSSFTLEAVVNIPNGKIIAITSSDTRPRELTRGAIVTGDLFTVGSGASLTLGNIVINGNKGVVANAGGSLVRVDGGTFIMNTGSQLRNNNYDIGGGVHISAGSFTMNGGAIAGNTSGDDGGGVYVSGGAVTMNGGSITDNHSYFSGGGVFVSDGAFTMTGGSIDMNTAGFFGGGAFVYGTFTMTGGTITYNTTNSSGGGVFVSGKIDFGSGGSVDATFNLGGSAVIENNTSGGSASNVDFDTASNYITLGTGAGGNGIAAPTSSMRVGVTKTTGNGVIVQSGAQPEHAIRFFSDIGGCVVYDNGALRIDLSIITASSFAELQQAIANAPVDVPTAITATGDFFLTGLITIPTGKNITIQSDSQIISNTRWLRRGAGVTGDLFTVSSGASLTLSYITIAGNKGTVADAQGVLVRSSGTLTLNSFATLRDNDTSGYTSGAVEITGGTFNLAGGFISFNTGYAGGGVALSGGAFNMTGGSIGSNNAQYGGGVLVNGGTFTMTGGMIVTSNSALGGGVYLMNGVFNMTGGLITSNFASQGGGIYISYGAFNMSGGELSYNTGDFGGGGIFYDDGTCTFGGAAFINDNTTGNLTTDNVCINDDNFITLGTGAGGNGVAVPESSMRIGVTKSHGDGIFVQSGAQPEHAACFFADNGRDILYNGGSLLIGRSASTAGSYAELSQAISDAPVGLPATIVITQNFNMTGTIAIMAGKNITITSDASTRTITRGVGITGHIFTIDSGAALTFGNIIIDGNRSNIPGGVQGALVSVNGGVFTMNGGTTLRNNKNSAPGGGVNVNSGEFTMNGGTIAGNSAEEGGGVYVYGGTFKMSGGLINGNSTDYGGGGVYLRNAAFTMTGGEISDNIASSRGGGGGVYVSISAVALGGSAVIENNTIEGELDRNVTLDSSQYITLGTGAGGNGVAAPTSSMRVGVNKSSNAGVFVQSGALPEHAARFFADDGSDILYSNGSLMIGRYDFIAGSFTELQTAVASAPVNVPVTISMRISFPMTGTITIPANKDITITSEDTIRTLTRGAGMTGHLFTVDSGASLTLHYIIIDGNSSNIPGTVDGALVHINGGAFTMNDGAVLRNNRHYLYGGGVYAYNGVFTMNGGSIEGNEASQAGGVYMRGGTFNMNGGYIRGNSVAHQGGGIEVYQGTFNMSGGTISNNTATFGGGFYAALTTFTMSGGSINANDAEYGGGVYVTVVTLVIGGSSVIENNTANGAANNVVLGENHYITLGNGSNGAGAPGPAMRVGVTKTADNAVFVQSGASASHADSFFADSGVVAYDNGTLFIKLTEFTALNFARLQQAIEDAPFNLPATITVTGNITIAEMIFISNGKNITIKSDATIRTLTRGVNGNLFTVEPGATLTMENITIDGNKSVFPYTNSTLVYIENGNFTMNGGTTLCNNDGISGVNVNDYGTFVMNGGTIHSNSTRATYRGAGVTVYTGAFTMNGGTISGNSARNGGGVCIYAGTFRMNGGTINGNSADSGGGVYMYGGTFVIGGSSVIENNSTTNGAADNVTLNTDCYVTLGNGSNGAGAPGPAMRVGVNKASNAGVFVQSGALLEHANLFFADNGCDIVYEAGQLKIVNPPVSSYSALQQAVNNAPVNTPLIIKISQSFTMTGTITIPEGKDITITSDGTIRTLMRSAGFTGHLFTVETGASLTMENITIDGNKNNVGNANGSLVYVNGTFIMNNGTQLQKNNYNIGNGGGVCVDSYGVFTMSGGAISENSSTNYGGGVYVRNGIFTMTEGTISDNTATYGGGGVYVQNGIFTMSGGTINNNTATISGGGVLASGGTFTMTGGMINTNNSNTGGGVYVSHSTFTMSGGTISGSTTDHGYGGGVYVYYGVFTMSGGTINSNSAAIGGGVFVPDGSTFTMSGGTISNNTATDRGGGVYVADYSTASLVIGGRSIIESNTTNGAVNNVWLGSTRYVTLGTGSNGADVPDSSMRVGVTKTGYDSVFVESGAIPEHANLFFADNGSGIEYEAGQLKIAKTIVSVSNYSELRQAVQNAPVNTPVTISVTQSFNITGTITIPAGRDITITSDAIIRTLKRGLGVTDDLFTVESEASLTMENITIDGNKDNYIILNANGSLVIVSGTFIMNNGTRLQNNRIDGTNYGGGVHVQNHGTFTMTGGTISGNSARYGGGVDVYDSTFTMTGGTISGNSATYDGGGVNVRYSTFTVTGGAITGNSAGSGGGVNVFEGTFNMSGGAISGNSAIGSSDGARGGGVYAFEGPFNMSGGEISGNSARNGGGVYYSRFGTNVGSLNLGGSAVIQNNTASDSGNNVRIGNNFYITLGTGASGNGVAVPTPFMSIGVTKEENNGVFVESGAMPEHANLFFADNGRSIGYSNGQLRIVDATYTVTYNGNGNTGGAAPVDPAPYVGGANPVALWNTGALTRTGYTFNGWNTAANGSGVTFMPGEPLNSLYTNITLYARWTTGPAAPSFMAHPENTYIFDGTNAVFIASASGSPAPVYSWECSTDNGATWAAVAGGTDGMLTLPSVGINMDGNMYRCVATNTSGTVRSLPATLNVTYLTISGTLSIDLNSENGTLTANTSAAFGGGDYTYFWGGRGVTNTSTDTLTADQYLPGETVYLSVGSAGANGSLTATIEVYLVSSGPTVTNGTTGTFSIPLFYGRPGDAAPCLYSEGDSEGVSFSYGAGSVYLFDDYAAYMIDPSDAVNGHITITATFVRAGTDEEILYGDVNGDGVVDMYDLSYLAMHLNKYPGYETVGPGADVNGDGNVDMYDLSYLAMHLNKYPGYEKLGP